MALQQENETGKAAASLMNQFINAGVVEQSPENEFIVNG